MNSLSRTQKPRAGFTLLEVMVVIVILGVLASLVVPNLLGNKEKADRQKAISDIVALENALDMYRLDNGRYPPTEQGRADPAASQYGGRPQLPYRWIHQTTAKRSVGQ